MQIQGFFLLFFKDLRLFGRNRGNLLSLLLFAVSVMILFHFAIPAKDFRSLSAGIFWVTFFFSSVLAIRRFEEIDRRNRVARAILFSPASRTVIYLSRTFALSCFLLIFQWALLPFFFIFFEDRIFSYFLEFSGISLLVLPGIAANGVLISAVTDEARFSEILMPILLFPILIPLFLAALYLSKQIFAGAEREINSDWLKLLLAYDLIFLSVGVIVYEFVAGD